MSYCSGGTSHDCMKNRGHVFEYFGRTGGDDEHKLRRTEAGYGGVLHV
jgi:hypothetical protein